MNTGKPKVRAKCHVRTGDTVMVISGANKGTTGTVIEVDPKRQRVVLDGEAAVYHTKHLRGDPNRNIEGGRVEKPRAIHISNVLLLDPETRKPTRVRRERTDGKVTRVSVKSGHRFEAQ
ncbi:MAG: 50S ribosomal protein L24 [Planctomycetota bacterium]